MFTSIFTYSLFYFFFFNDTATTEIYTLSLHDALPIYPASGFAASAIPPGYSTGYWALHNRLAVLVETHSWKDYRSEEHTSELQSQFHLVCRLLLEKKKKYKKAIINSSQSKR